MGSFYLETFQRAFAAFLAICFRFRSERDLARAMPPLEAPSLLSATAAGFRVSGGSTRFLSGFPSIVSPMRSSITDRASRLGSRGRFGLLAREGMVRLWHTVATFIITISPTSSYEIDVPDGIRQDIDGRVTSLWLEGSRLALQLSSFKRSEGEQVPAKERLRDRIKRDQGSWTDFALRLPPEIDVAAALMTDMEGTAWLHAYLTWPDLCIYVTLSGPPEQIAEAKNWAYSALSSLRRVRPLSN